MRYFSVPSLEASESALLTDYFGRHYQPAGSVTLAPDSVLDRAGTETVDVHGELLAIHPDAGAWAFLDRAEAHLFQSMRQGKLASLPPGSAEFAAALYRRGLLSINGHRAVDESMFSDGPNYEEAHLVELLVTERCNLGCVYCLAGASAKMPSMTEATAERAVDLAFGMKEASVLGFEFSGGEPFLRFDLMQHTVNYILNHPGRNGRKVYFSVQSNGTLLNRERVEWLLANNVTIGLSMDGEPWAQNQSRPMLGGGASYAALMRGVDLLRAAGIRFGALVVLNRSNVRSAESLCRFLVEKEILSIKLNPVAFLGTARMNWDATGLSQEEVVRYFRELIDLLASGRYPLVEANLHTMLQHLVSKRRTTRCLRGHCGAGDTFQAISAAGTIYPCGRSTQSPGLQLGTVTDPSLRSLSQPAAGNRHILQIRARRPETLEGCSSCEYREFCQAGCSAQAFERYGTVRHRTPECHFYKTMYPELMHRLTFDEAAFSSFNQLGYLGAGGRLHDQRFLRALR